MPLTHGEAADALREISKTERRAFSAYGYKSAAPFLILWGCLWLLGYGATDLIPQFADWVWLAIVVVGTAGSTLLGMRASPGKTKFSWHIFSTWLAALAALSSIIAIMRPVSGTQIGAVIPVLVGWAYVVMGIWMGSRFTAAGLAIVALTLFGFFLLTAHFGLWMAFIGGATLIGTGLWLRSA